ncbi:MAG: type IV secretion system DNA-binding domain-containing protein [Patescibacteria group bacterium]
MSSNEPVTYFAETDFRGKKTKFGIRRKDRARHVYVIGKTGMGKSTMLENMAIQDIQNGEGLAFIDPHGATAEKLLQYVPEHRIKDVIYFAPWDLAYPLSFNVMEDVGKDQRHLVANGLMAAFKKIWPDVWSARMEYILNNIILALLEYPDSTLLGVNRMLADKAFRDAVVANVTDPSIKAFWVDEFAKYTDKFMTEAGAAIQNKIGQFTSNPLIRNIVGQPKGSLNIRKIMDEKKILIMNLSKGRMGEINANLIGGMLITKIYLAAMSRASASPAEMAVLPDFYFYVDEFQSFVNESFKDILSEARKYKLCLTIAHQYIEQMPEEVRDAVFGNVGTTIAFRVGPFDAEVLEKVFEPQFMAIDIVGLGFAQIYLTLMIDGVGSPPFSARTIDTISPPPISFVPRIMEWTRGTYAKPVAIVEEEVRKWHEPIIPPRKELPPRAQGGMGPPNGDRPHRQPSFFKIGAEQQRPPMPSRGPQGAPSGPRPPARDFPPRGGSGDRTASSNAGRSNERPLPPVRPRDPLPPPAPFQPSQPPAQPAVSLEQLKKNAPEEGGKTTLREALAAAMKEQEERKKNSTVQSASSKTEAPRVAPPQPSPVQSAVEPKREEKRPDQRAPVASPEKMLSPTAEEIKRMFETGTPPEQL